MLAAGRHDISSRALHSAICRSAGSVCDISHENMPFMGGGGGAGISASPKLGVIFGILRVVDFAPLLASMRRLCRHLTFDQRKPGD